MILELNHRILFPIYQLRNIILLIKHLKIKTKILNQQSNKKKRLFFLEKILKWEFPFFEDQ